MKNSTKNDAEIRFWMKEINNYMDWYQGRLLSHYDTPTPDEKDKITHYDLKTNAILTWLNQHQKVKYLKDLSLIGNEFRGKKVLDIGSGPMPSALALENIELYCLDPLHSKYAKAGSPYSLQEYENVIFVEGSAEKLPFGTNFFDVVLTVNAIDHVDDLSQTAEEIQRVLKPNGTFLAHVHYHKKTVTEPIEINDKIFRSLFSSIHKLKKISESNEKHGYTCDSTESYTLWSNLIHNSLANE